MIKLIFAVYNACAYGKFEFSLFTEPHLPWFMLALFAFAVITIAVRDFSPKYVLFFSILLACLAGYDREINSFLSLSRIIVYYPFYYLGYMLDAAKIEEFFRKKLREIPSGWRSALSAARSRGDSAAAMVEKLKLDSVAEIEGWLER